MMRCTGPILLLAALSLALPAGASETERLQDIARKWQEARARDIPLEIYLRPLVAEDPAFNPDPGLAVDGLQGDMHQTWLGLQYLLTEGMKRQFLGLSSDSLRSEWLRRYWRLRDPTPTTPRNERWEEHQRRVQVARDRFAWKKEPYWDERGRIYILFGQPDTVISDVPDIREGPGFIPAREDWLYLDEEWVAQFEQPNPKGPFVYGRSSQDLSYRPDIVREDRRRLGYDNPMDALTAEGRDRQGDIIGLQDERRLMQQKDPERMLSDDVIEMEVRSDLRAKELLRKEQEAIQAFSKEVESGSDRFIIEGPPRRNIWYVFDVDVFRGSTPRMRVEVHYQFNMQDLTFQWQDSLYVARYHVEGVLLDRNVREAARDTWTETLKATEFQSTTQAQLLPGQVEFVVPSGKYRLALRLVDEFSGDDGAFTTDVFVPDKFVPEEAAEQLVLSDLQMASRIVYAGHDWKSRFVKNDRLVVPNPIGIYRRGHQVTGYVEIYGLTLNDDNLCRYQVTTRILPRGTVRPDGWLPGSTPLQKPFVSSSFSETGNTTMRTQELRIDVSSLDQDVYDLELTVEDLVAGTRATARAAFSIIE
jgi:GWxTD domain-containing protein